MLNRDKKKLNYRWRSYDVESIALCRLGPTSMVDSVAVVSGLTETFQEAAWTVDALGATNTICGCSHCTLIDVCSFIRHHTHIGSTLLASVG